MSFRLMKARMNQSGLSMREETISDARELLEWENENDPSYCSTLFIWVPGINPHKSFQIHARLYNRKYSSANGRTIMFQTKHSEKVDIGDLLFNEFDSSYWLCTESYDMDSIYYKGKLTQCNIILKWQNKNGDILFYPSQDINATQYNSGESSGKTMSLGSSQHMETMPADENTIMLDSPQRFFVDKNLKIPTCYKVSQNDTTACDYGNGLVKVTIAQTEKDDAKDKLITLDSGEQVWIADYISPTTPPVLNPSPDQNIILSIEGRKQLKIGRPERYIAIAKDAAGNDLAHCNIKWNIKSDFDNEISQVIDNKTITLMVKNENYIDSSFLLCATTDDSNYSSEIEITVDGIF